MPFLRRIPKFGFNNNQFRFRFEVVNVGDLDEKFNDGDVVDQAALRSKRLVNRRCDGLKILGDGPLAKKLTVRAEKFTKSALEKIQKAGGKAEVVPVTVPAKGPEKAGKAAGLSAGSSAKVEGPPKAGAAPESK